MFHMAPEILRQGEFDMESGSSLATKKTDMYGLGMLLYQVFTRLPLFAESDETSEGLLLYFCS